MGNIIMDIPGKRDTNSVKCQAVKKQKGISTTGSIITDIHITA